MLFVYAHARKKESLGFLRCLVVYEKEGRNHHPHTACARRGSATMSGSVKTYSNDAALCAEGPCLSGANATPRRTSLYCPFSASGHKRVIAWSDPVAIQMRLTILSDRLSFDLRVTHLIYKLFITVSSFFPGLMDICQKFDAVFKRSDFSKETERRRIESTRQAYHTGGDNARQGPAVDASSKQS